jgi:hypothetical protein
MTDHSEEKPLKVWADFNGLFGELLCLSHGDTSTDEHGTRIALRAGMKLTAFDQDLDDEGNRDDLVATGVVERSPRRLRCNGSRWVLRIDENGVRNESDFRKKSG